MSTRLNRMIGDKSQPHVQRISTLPSIDHIVGRIDSTIFDAADHSISQVEDEQDLMDKTITERDFGTPFSFIPTLQQALGDPEFICADEQANDSAPILVDPYRYSIGTTVYSNAEGNGHGGGRESDDRNGFENAFENGLENGNENDQATADQASIYRPGRESRLVPLPPSTGLAESFLAPDRENEYVEARGYVYAAARDAGYKRFGDQVQTVRRAAEKTKSGSSVMARLPTNPRYKTRVACTSS